MKSNHENSPKTASSVAPTTLNLQTRPFAPIEAGSAESPSTEKTEKSEHQQKYSPNILERLINSPPPEPASSVQRKPENRLKAIAQNRSIQAKLAIGEPNDKYEKEADDTASKVVQQINTPIQNQSIQRDALPQGNKLRKKPLQRRENVGGGDASTELESSIQSARGGGQPLAANLQRSMGQAMGADFSGVKVHTDSQSDQLNQSIQAKAFTTGQDVFFRQGAYEPSSRGGQELIAHELTHVVQQNGGAVQRSPQPTTTSSVGDERIQRLFGFGKKKKQGYQQLDDDNDQEALLDDSESVEEEEDGVKIEAGPLSYQNGVVTIPIWGDQELKIGRSGVDLEGALPSKEFALKLPSLGASIDIPFAPGAYATAGLAITPKVSFTISGGTYSIKTGDEKTLSISDAGVTGTMGLEIQATAGVGAGVANVVGLEGGIFGALGGTAELTGTLGGTANFSTKSYALNLGLNASADIVGKAGVFVKAKLMMLSAEKTFDLVEKTFANFSYTRDIELGGSQGAWWPSITDFTKKEYGDVTTTKRLKTINGKKYEELIDEDESHKAESHEDATDGVVYNPMHKRTD
ncbi:MULTISPECIES: DUF4157 domain-containing protein [Pseudanabaena]|uniref:eCIS core domain-containing protein n=1 Tax=Pseudanabaena TaxID=1152 RepID=UPI002479C24E|nr:MULTISPECIES: DUF4157 domain-containing protein [Pseudanabaena]MEA5485179.1 DUF4157 domain-containing protein [Pseudanabaena sp. CCNP1317]WGS72689.1 DUF4157 domain-containing protein [Pseudanabaena galeata CCNP1313]